MAANGNATGMGNGNNRSNGSNGNNGPNGNSGTRKKGKLANGNRNSNLRNIVPGVLYLPLTSCPDILATLHGFSIRAQKELLGKLIDGKSPLYKAVFDYKPDIVECLLKLGADPNISGDGANTPLHTAVYYNYTPIVELLVNGIKDPATGNVIGAANPVDGRTLPNKKVFRPLYAAAERGHTKIVELLLTKQAVKDTINVPLSIDDDLMMTPFVIAILQGNKDIVDALKVNGALVSKFHKLYTKSIFEEFVADAAEDKNLKQLKMLLENDDDHFGYVKKELELEAAVEAPDVNSLDFDYSILYYALNQPDNEEVIEYLLYKGANLKQTEYERLMVNDNFLKKYKTLYDRARRPITTPPPTPLRRTMYTNDDTPRAAGGAGAGGGPGPGAVARAPPGGRGIARARDRGERGIRAISEDVPLPGYVPVSRNIVERNIHTARKSRRRKDRKSRKPTRKARRS